MSKSIAEIITLPDPIGKVLKEWKRPNGLEFQQISVPIGVIGVIYESRPNVTIDASCIAIKSGNTIILRGGSDSFNSSNKLVYVSGSNEIPLTSAPNFSSHKDSQDPLKPV